MRSALWLALAIPSLLAAQVQRPGAAPARGGDRPCELIFTGVERNGQITTEQIAYKQPSGDYNTFIGGGVDATCRGQGNRLLADSAEFFGDQGLLILIANVRYTEARMRLTSDKMYYYTREERLTAEGNVKGRSSSGTRFEGPQAEYLRPKPGLRAAPRWTAIGRPFVRMSPTEIGGATTTSADSVDLTANFVTSENDSLLWASGAVLMERRDLSATGDSAYLDNGREYARLMRKPRIVGRGERSFTLDGEIIDLWSKSRKLTRVLALASAKVVSDSLTLRSDTIDLRMADQRVQRVYAWGTRAFAESPSQRVEADSLDVLMPNQRMQEMRAHGGAVAFSAVDTLRIESDEPDWLRGDSLIALFDSVATAAATTTARMRQITASGNARSYYQLVPTSRERGLPNISYVRGREITVRFDAGEVSTVDVVDQASGVLLEPNPVETRPAPAAARPPAIANPVRRP